MKNPDKRNKEKWLSLEDAASHLSYKKSSLYQFTSRNLIPHYKIRRKILFKLSELNDYIEKHRISTSAEIEAKAISNIVNGK
jgi:excisionase family DNA binding protein